MYEVAKFLDIYITSWDCKATLMCWEGVKQEVFRPLRDRLRRTPPHILAESNNRLIMAMFITILARDQTN